MKQQIENTVIGTDKWVQANKDLPFLIEIRDKLVAGEKDSTQKDFAMNMIDDWINEMSEIVNK